jgi:hypothetical protein
MSPVPRVRRLLDHLPNGPRPGPPTTTISSTMPHTHTVFRSGE